MSYIDLNSVGSTVTEEGMVFPIDCSEAPETASEAEEMMGTHLMHVDSEWFTSLSSDDLVDFFEFVKILLILLLSRVPMEICLSLLYATVNVNNLII